MNRHVSLSLCWMETTLLLLTDFITLFYAIQSYKSNVISFYVFLHGTVY